MMLADLVTHGERREGLCRRGRWPRSRRCSCCAWPRRASRASGRRTGPSSTTASRAGPESVIQAMRARMDGGAARTASAARAGACATSRTRASAFGPRRSWPPSRAPRAIRPEACPSSRGVAREPDRGGGPRLYFEWPAHLAEERPLWWNVLRHPIARCQSRRLHKAIADAAAANRGRRSRGVPRAARGRRRSTRASRGACALARSGGPRLGAASDKAERQPLGADDRGVRLTTDTLDVRRRPSRARFDDPRLLTIAKAHVDARRRRPRRVARRAPPLPRAAPACSAPPRAFAVRASAARGAGGDPRTPSSRARASTSCAGTTSSTSSRRAHARAPSASWSRAAPMPPRARAHAHIPRSCTVAAKQRAICALAVAGAARGTWRPVL